MTDEHEEEVTSEEQALADEWAAALAEAGDSSQDDIDAMLAQAAEPEPAPVPQFDHGPESSGKRLAWMAPTWT